jgi:hypothetical protein
LEKNKNIRMAREATMAILAKALETREYLVSRLAIDEISLAMVSF